MAVASSRSPVLLASDARALRMFVKSAGGSPESSVATASRSYADSAGNRGQVSSACAGSLDSRRQPCHETSQGSPPAGAMELTTASRTWIA